MGRPLNKKLFGANAENNIKIQFNNGSNSVPGYIVKQKGSKRFLCEDVDGNQLLCKMVQKDSNDLLPGEMSITFKYDDNTVRHAYKIAAHKISINPVNTGTSLVGMVSQGWTFATSTTDQRWQIEEAGTSTTIMSTATNAVDFEGDDPATLGLFDLPAPGSGTFAATLSGANLTKVGTAYTATGVTTITSPVAGLWRKKYKGNFGASAGSGINVNFVSTSTGYFGKPDTYVSFGDQNIATEENYTFDWQGYFKAPADGVYNFYVKTDDDTYLWLGANAQSITTSNYHLYASNATGAKNSNSVNLTADTYYPVRIQFGEYSGAEKMQIFWASTSSAAAYAGDDGTGATQVWYHNGTTKGF